MKYAFANIVVCVTLISACASKTHKSGSFKPDRRFSDKSPILAEHESDAITTRIVVSQIDGEFDGLDTDKIYRLTNGQVWQQTEPYIWVYVAVMPTVVVTSSYGQFIMKVEGIDHAVGVRLIAGPGVPDASAQANRPSDVVESRIVGPFEGFKLDKVYQLANGQFWKQTDFRIRVRVRVNPRVIIWRDGNRWTMQVDDIDTTVTVIPLGSIESAPTVGHSASDGPTRSAADSIEAVIASGKGRLIAHDGTFLGRLGGEFDADSIGNEFGIYGSEFSVTSIFNQFGNYGGQFSTLSPYNGLTETPPSIYVDDKAVLFVTTNESLTPRVYPDVMRAMLKR